MGFVSSLSSILGKKEDQRTASCSLIDMDDSGSPIAASQLAFQYFPETISDSYSTEWVQKNIVGGSHPIYQWIHGNARTISFEAVFSADSDPYTLGSNGPLGGITSAINDVGALANAISSNPISTAIGLVTKSVGGNAEAIDVAGGIAWLRSKLYPDYQKRVAIPPLKMFLVLPNSGVVSVSTATSSATGGNGDAIPVIMLSCNVTYEAFFRSGSPRVATVAMEFAETIQLGTTNWNYVARSNVTPIYQSGNRRLYTKGRNGTF